MSIKDKTQKNDSKNLGYIPIQDSIIDNKEDITRTQKWYDMIQSNKKKKGTTHLES